MYAAVKAGPQGLLISNDEMRDHLFQLLAPRFFQKWKQRHQVCSRDMVGFRSQSNAGGLPASYTVAVAAAATLLSLPSSLALLVTKDDGLSKTASNLAWIYCMLACLLHMEHMDSSMWHERHAFAAGEVHLQ